MAGVLNTSDELGGFAFIKVHRRKMKNSFETFISELDAR